MQEGVRQNFLSWTRTFEGWTDYFYLDSKGYVTIGAGNLAEPLHLVDLLHFRIGPREATPNEISSQWLRVKVEQGHKGIGGGHAFWKSLTTVRATEESIVDLCVAKLSSAEAVCLRHFPGWNGWPWQAQLGCLSMVWAMGDRFSQFTKFTLACNRGDWATASRECEMSEEENAPLHPRNVANMNLFLEAAAAVESGGTIYVEPDAGDAEWVKIQREK